MAVSWSVAVCTSMCLLLVFAFNIACASSGGSRTDFTCSQVREFFEKDFGSPEGLLPQPQLETESSICRRGKPGEEYSCCSVETEGKLAESADKRLKKNVRTQNHSLRKHITNSLARYQDRIAQLVREAQNRTSVSLTRLHKVPVSEHEELVSSFFTGIQRNVVAGSADSGLDDTVRDFFTDLFPAVFNFVLSVQGQEERRPMSIEYHACLKRYADQIQPFGNQPDVLLRHLRRSMNHAIIFRDAMKTFLDAMTCTEAVTMNANCQHALVRLQVCPRCRGLRLQNRGVKPCRGMCLNVMRGCLAKISEISSSWDELVVSFGNLQLGMLGQHELQKMLMYLDMNISEAIMMAMADSARIYDEVKVKCRSIPKDDPNREAAAVPLLPDVTEAIPPRDVETLQAFHQEVKSLVKYLEDSRGMFNRLADAMCQNEEEYSQDMQSPDCWNGTAIARYMAEVPEVNFMSQVQRNKEVKVHLMETDFKFLQCKEMLIHMRRNLSSLLNADFMLGDSPGNHYKSVAASEGSGQNYATDVIVDDEDLVAGGSASGSGSGEDPVTAVDPPVITTKLPKPTQPRHGTPGSGSGSGGGSQKTTISLLLLAFTMLSHRLYDTWK